VARALAGSVESRDSQFDLLTVNRGEHRAIPTKLFEFMAAGLPIVASDLPYQTEVVGGNNAGLLAKPEEPETFVRAILTLLDNRELAKELGENGRKAFQEKYTWESQEEALGDYYRSIMNSSTLVDCKEVRR
jgi:glycosyltransferase involved in cell wall biosynthesis